MAYDYLDEKIVRVRNQNQKKYDRFHIDLSQGMKIDGKLCEFEERYFFDKCLRIWLPKNMIEMSKREAKIKYPYSDRPQIIQTDEENLVDFTFSYLEDKIEKNQVEHLKAVLIVILICGKIGNLR